MAAFLIQYMPEAKSHLKGLSAYNRKWVMDAIDEQLEHEPSVATKNRKRLRPNPLAPWELRVDQFRVYYDAEETPVAIVSILAIGIKKGSRVWIGGEEVDL